MNARRRLAPFAGAGALLVGIGLARFAYVPIFPAMVAAGWVDGGGAGLLGACNLTGYLLGALGGRGLGRRLGVPRALDLGMALATLAFLACALRLDGAAALAWLGAWRGLAGFAGGVLMALAGPAVQAVVPAARRAAAGGVVMSGVAFGVVLGGSLVPPLLLAGISGLWIGLGLASLAVWLVLRPAWPDPPMAETMGTPAGGQVPRATRLLATYALAAAGMVAPMVYLADLGARGRGLEGLALAMIWVLFGLGGIAGTLTGGRLVGWLGGRRAMMVWMMVEVAALACTLLPGGAAVLLAAPLGGFSGIGISAVALGAAREQAGSAAGILWVRATALFALAQAATGFALAALFKATGESHTAVFGAGLGLAVLALGASMIGGKKAG
ncbi:YbfB/YjiJ family MFS transporter [Roseomonas sp. USHLN139]|uniref:YbfB/YjiJ family MFS transporter n=1 Tax=Roseomonas sp. USHLN139 TaxID=3081298 RepID=UPI003B02EA7B